VLSASRLFRFIPVERTMVSMDRRLDGPQDRSGRLGEEISPMPVPEFEPRIVQPVFWSLYQLSYDGSQKCCWFYFPRWMISHKMNECCVKPCWLFQHPHNLCHRASTDSELCLVIGTASLQTKISSRLCRY
jgi:hypothetical protein